MSKILKRSLNLRFAKTHTKKACDTKTQAFLFIRVGYESEESQGSHLDAFPRRRIGRTGGIVEGAMSRPAGAAVFYRVEGFEHHRFVTLHIGEVIPAVFRVKSAVIDFADPVRVNRARWEISSFMPMLLASAIASGSLCTGCRMGRQIWTTAKRRLSNSSASSGNRSRTRCGPDHSV